MDDMIFYSLVTPMNHVELWYNFKDLIYPYNAPKASDTFYWKIISKYESKVRGNFPEKTPGKTPVEKCLPCRLSSKKVETIKNNAAN